ncbi:hypothetical protein DHEL01_v204633 [Diaporthe helianthi]|uniref:Uncharacterized protein n=1 Tax=Diaporthe helianthi TaxID=158607 RepID=A0A2P5I3B9_DIAHE|nr:hypothetical protein DHEL01_v204633 [Diaporthe helianthi]
MVFTAPIFWHSAQHVQPHQLPDARSDPKGRTLLRRMRNGYASVSDEAMPNLGSDTQSERTQTPETPAENPFESPAHNDDPPEYDLSSLGQDLPPALPGYTPLPDSAPRPIGKEDPEPRQRRRYLYVLKRSISSTKQKLNKSSAKSIDGDTDSSAESERGVVLYQQDNQWVNIEEPNVVSFPEVSPRTFRGWMRKVWRGMKEFCKEHPALFILAVFIIFIVAMCLLI